MPNTYQISLPVPVNLDELRRKKTLGAALELCAHLGGFELDKELQLRLKTDKGQFSRWMSGQEGISWAKFGQLMDTCGNDAPLLWMLDQRGYELAGLHKRETETEQQLRMAMEEVAALRRVLMGQGVKV